MVNPMRVKEVSFSGLTFSGSPNAGAVTYTDTSINGQIQQVEWAVNNFGAGSLQIYPSGLPAMTIFQRNAPSGAATQIAHPFVFPENFAGSIANNNMIPFVVNEPLALFCGSCGSYSTTLNVKVKYI